MGTRKEEKILEEIQRRVFEEDEKLAQQRESETLRKATFEVLKENTSLSDNAIEKIAREVRGEINRKRKLFFISLFSVLVIALSVTFLFLSGGEKETTLPKKKVHVKRKAVKSVKPKVVKKTINRNTLTKINTAVKHLNTLIRSSNLTIIGINKSFLCLSNFWDFAQYSRKSRRYRRRFECAINYDENIMKKNIQKLKSAGLYVPSIENSAEQYNIKIKELVRKYNELIIYQRKENNRDDFEGARVIISEIIEITNQIKRVKGDFAKSIQDTYKEIVADYITKEQYQKLNKYISDEISLQRMWKYNLSKKIWTNSIPYDAIYNNYKKYGFLNDKDFYGGLNLDRNIKNYYIYTLRNLKSRNNNKKKIIDRRHLYYWDNDMFANESYRNLDTVYLIKAYNYFADRSVGYRKPLLKRHQVIWDIGFNEKTGGYPFRKYSKVGEINNKKIKGGVKESSISYELFKTLGLVIKYLNNDLLRRSRDIQYSINYYQRNDPVKKQDNRRRRRRRRSSSMNLRRIAPVSQTEYEGLIYILKQKNINREIVNQITNLKNLSDEIYHKTIIIGLKSHTDADYLKKNESKPYLKEIDLLLKKLEKQKNVLVTNLSLIYDGFKVDYNNPIIATASKFSQVLDIASGLFYRKSKEEDVLNNLEKEYNYLIEKQFELLEGVPRGSRRYSSPYYKYERFNKSLKLFCKSVGNKKDKELILKRYNSMVSYYNDFATISVNKSMVLGRDMIITDTN